MDRLSDEEDKLEQELAELLEEEAKADALRSLPLYSCGITGWRFVLHVKSVISCWGESAAKRAADFLLDPPPFFRVRLLQDF